MGAWRAAGYLLFAGNFATAGAIVSSPDPPVVYKFAVSVILGLSGFEIAWRLHRSYAE